MNLLNKKSWKFCNTLLILSLAFQMFTAVTPAAASANSVNPSGSGTTGNIGYVPVPVKNSGKTYYFAAFAGNETINEVESYLSIDRNTLGFKGLIIRFLRFLLPVAGFSVLALCFGYVINKKEQHKSILSILLGGHSPPFRLLLPNI